MNSKRFSLEPFEEAGLPGLTITGEAGRNSSIFTISYTLRGPISRIIVPAPAETPARKNGLWEETCLEFFLAEKNAGRYREFNLSPSGDWNVYGFASYRQDMREEPAFTSLPFRVESGPGSLTLSLELGLDRIIPADEALEVAVCAVIKSTGGSKTYWALHHPGPWPDFHRRDGFTIQL